MRIVILTTLTVVILLLQFTASSQGVRKPRRSRDICGKASSIGDMDRCDFRIFNDAEKRLNKGYELLRSKLDEREKSVLEQSQRAWLAFRDANCELASSFAHRQCMTRMTWERISELRNYDFRFMQRH